jgi:hypothetical protein
LILSHCSGPASSYISVNMSALEVIEQIKALPPAEKAQVVDFVRQMEAPSEKDLETRYMDQDAFHGAKKKVFAKHAELLNRLAK